MRRRTRPSGERTRIGRSLFFHPRFSKYSEIIHIDTPSHARASAEEMKSLFNSSTHRDAKRRIKLSCNLAANRASAIRHKANLSSREFTEMVEVEKIYREAVKSMILPKEGGD